MLKEIILGIVILIFIVLVVRHVQWQRLYARWIDGVVEIIREITPLQYRAEEELWNMINIVELKNKDVDEFYGRLAGKLR